jgi:hypothetical protein
LSVQRSVVEMVYKWAVHWE